jgi:hypothetical protein
MTFLRERDSTLALASYDDRLVASARALDIPIAEP